MDPLTATMNTVTAYINWSAARFAAASPENQKVIGDIDAALIKEMWDLAVKVHDDLGSITDKVKGMFGHSPSAPVVVVTLPAKVGN